MASDWPFDSNVPKNQWAAIQAQGLPDPVAGCVYEGQRLDGGLPIGGLGTGYFTLEGAGKIGFCSIFNDIVPPRQDFSEWLTIRIGQQTATPLSEATIDYWGHYPVADLVCHFDNQALRLGIRAFAPFILGDARDSNIPAALFEIEIVNEGSEALDIELVIDLPQPPDERSGQTSLMGDDFATGAVFKARLAAHEARRTRFVYAWYSPHWRDSGNEAHVHQYARRYDSAQAVAADALERFESLLGRVLAWQQVLYTSALPGWLQDGLIQSFYSLAKNTVWIAKTRKDEWWGENGWFSHNESHTGCPITETMVCRMHGHFPALFFFPELEISTLEAFRHFQIGDGEIPFSYGMGTSMRDPRYHCQHPLNAGQYAQMIYRLYRRTSDEQLLAQFYDSAKRAIRYQYTLDDDGDGLVNDQAHVKPGELWPANQFYDIWPWWGTSAYVAGTWLATLACGQALATAMNDTAFAGECQQWLARGQAAYQDKLWTGDYYRLWRDPGNLSGQGERSDISLGNQLMSQWCIKVAGLGDVLPAKSITAALGTIERLNMAATAHGLVNGVTPDGDRYDSKVGSDADVVTIAANNDHASQVFVGENLCAAMTFIYHGQQATGLEIARRIYEAIALHACSPWNQRCLIDADSGLPVWGDDYYSNMVIWAVPMALNGQDIQAFTGENGLVEGMMNATS